VVQENGRYVEFLGKKLEYVSGILNEDGGTENLNSIRSTPSGGGASGIQIGAPIRV
jgi:hypothetical protein